MPAPSRCRAPMAPAPRYLSPRAPRATTEVPARWMTPATPAFAAARRSTARVARTPASSPCARRPAAAATRT
jgi:hypothetical protein